MPDLFRVRITQVKGTLFNTIGYSAHRELLDGKWAKRLELLPEEALYLIERGSLICLRQHQVDLPDDQLATMSAQQAFSEMVGKEGLTFERYQVSDSLLNFSLLKQHT
jgi:tRNA-splicing endonuclease subunit Sen54